MKIDNSGQILVEVLIAIAVAAAVAVLGSQLVFISLVGNKISGDNNVASGLAEETIEGAKAAAAENWLNIYSLTHGNTQYYSQKSGGKWIVTAGRENIKLNSSVYSRYFVVQNICRDTSSRTITGLSDSNGADLACGSISGSQIDLSTQKITVYVAWPGAATSSDAFYLTRWRNHVCVSTDWSGGKNYPNDNVFTSCSVNTYYNDDGHIDNSTAGAIKLKSS
jgi:type II secretory pathway pseudopilin PulG